MRILWSLVEPETNFEYLITKTGSLTSTVENIPDRLRYSLFF